MKINKIFILTLSLVMILSMFSGCRKVNNENSSDNTSDTTSVSYGVVDVLEDENSDAQSTDDATSDDEQDLTNSGDVDSSSVNSDTTYNNDNTESKNDTSSAGTTSKNNTSLNTTTSNKNNTSSKDSATSSTNTVSNNIVSVGDGGNKDDTAEEELPPTYIDPTPDVTTTPDSSNDQNTTDESNSNVKKTYMVSPNTKGKVVTVDIAAGQSVYYKIARVSNKVMTINSPNAFVIYNGVKHTAKNGVLSFFVESDLLASDQILFEIGNSGSSVESFSIYFTSPVGSMDNKEKLESIGEKITKDLQKGNDTGYFYTYTAEKDGKIKFYILSGTKTGVLTVERIRNLIVAQRNTDSEEEGEVNTDKVGTYLEFDVEKGDTINMMICGKEKDDKGQLKAVTIEWKAIYD